MLFIDNRGMVDMFLIAKSRYPDLFERKDLNGTGLADVVWFRKDGVSVQTEVKRGLEANPTGLTEQLQRQIPMADITNLMVVGPVSKCDGGSVVWESSGKFMRQSKSTQQDYTWYRRELGRFADAGVHIWELPTMEDAVEHLVALYKNDQDPKDGIFNRLIVEKRYLSVEDEAKRKMALALMGLPEARVGEEVGLAIAEHVQDLTSLVHLLESDKDEYNGSYLVANYRLSSGRRVGDAAVTRLKNALGIK